MPVPYRKLVRDRIPEIIQADGRHPVTRVLDEASYRRALLGKLAGRDGGRWQVSASTARSWRSRFAGRAGALRQALMGVLPLADPLSRPFAPAGSPAGDCLTVLEAVTAGLRCRFPALAAVTAHEVAAHLTGGRWLAPAVPAIRLNTTLLAADAVPPP